MNHHFISVNMSMEQGVDFSLFLKRMARKRKLVYDEVYDSAVKGVLLLNISMTQQPII